MANATTKNFVLLNLEAIFQAQEKNGVFDGFQIGDETIEVSRSKNGMRVFGVPIEEFETHEQLYIYQTLVKIGALGKVRRVRDIIAELPDETKKQIKDSLKKWGKDHV